MKRASETKTANTAGRLDEAPLRRLPLPIPMPLPPMEATRADRLPLGEGWQFEPKWDGFRCLVFRSEKEIVLQSKAGQPLSRYFPELVDAFMSLPEHSFVLDGEIVVFRNGVASFDDLLLRIHPAASRVTKLAHETPATFMAFDLLYSTTAGSLLNCPLEERRSQLEQFFASLPRTPRMSLSPYTNERALAERWFQEFGPLGLDGIMAKNRQAPYRSGTRDAMVKVKHLRTADCVVGGFRYAAKDAQREKNRRTAARSIGSLLLGLYDEDGLLHFVGFTSSFTRDARAALNKVIEPLRGGSGFTGRAPGGPSRWTVGESREWERLDPVLVCEVEYDYFSQGRFRHGTKLLRWRPD